MNSRMNQLFSIGFRKWCYNTSGFNQFGLMLDDILYEDEVVKEALRRLPQEIKDQRNFRIIRAMQLDACKRILPKEEWTKFEEDIPYLRPIMRLVEEERREKEEWEES